jgi:hypothetical protein
MLHKIALFAAGLIFDFMGFIELTSPYLNSIAPQWEWGVLFFVIGIILNVVGVFL